MSIKRNTSYNIAGAIIPVGVTLVTLPLFIRTIGDARYGVLAILWTLLGYFGLCDLGIGRAVTNRIAALREASRTDREEVFWTALVLNLCLGTIGAVGLWAIGRLLFAHYVRVPGPLVGEVQAALPLMAAVFPLWLIYGVISGALSGREEFLYQNVVRVGEGILIQIVPLMVAIKAGPTLAGLVLGTLAVRCLSVVCLFLLCTIHVPLRRIARPRWAIAQTLFSYGGWVTITSIVGPILDGLDRVVIGSVAGVSAVAYYTVPFSLVSKMSIIPGSLSAVLFPRFSAHAREEDRQHLSARSIEAIAVFLTPVSLLGIVAMEPFLSCWIGEAFSMRASAIGEFLFLGTWANCIGYVPFAMLQGSGRPDLVAKIHVAEVVPYLLLLWAALVWWGPLGAAIAWSLRCVVDTLLLLGLARSTRGTLALLRTPFALLVASTVLVLSFGPGSLIRWAGSLLIVVLGSWWAWKHAPDELRGLLRRAFPCFQSSHLAHDPV